METLRLKWDDLDWFRKSIRIERELVRPDNTGVKFLEPKLKSGKRTIDLDEITMQLLRGHYEHLQAELLATGRKWEEHA